VPGDISSAAFFLAGAALLHGSDVTVESVGVNPTRTGFLDALAVMGVPVEVTDRREVLGEPLATIRVRSAEQLGPVEVSGSLVPRLIDEIPMLAVLMAAAHGTSVVADAAELRVKESDRIASVALGLEALGVEIEVRSDGFAVEGPQALEPGRVSSRGDHRIAMAFCVAGLASPGTTVVDGASCVATSYPGFAADLATLELPA
jgi:3-phosphoshikimate 1-carboxyvinyltransferase